MKRILVLMMCFISFSCFAAIKNISQITVLAPNDCGHAAPIGDPNFCSTFKDAVSCHCVERGISPTACDHMKVIYQMMMEMYHNNLADACSHQKDAPTQECIDDWNSYNSTCNPTYIYKIKS